MTVKSWKSCSKLGMRRRRPLRKNWLGLMRMVRLRAWARRESLLQGYDRDTKEVHHDATYNYCAVTTQDYINNNSTSQPISFIVSLIQILIHGSAILLLLHTSSINSNAGPVFPNAFASGPNRSKQFRKKACWAGVSQWHPAIVMGNTSAR